MNPHCESYQKRLSDALDEGKSIPPELSEHARQCADCAAFLALWQDDGAAILSQEHAPAGLALRQKILALPSTNSSAERSPRIPIFLQAVAALVVLGFSLFHALDVRKTGLVAQGGQPADDVLDHFAQQELTALEADFKNGMQDVARPLASLRNALASTR